MGKIATSLVPVARSSRALARREAIDGIGPVGGALVKMAVAQGWTPHQLSKAITREAARTSSVGELAARLGVDPAMGAPFAGWDENRMSGSAMGPGAPAMPFPLGGEPRQFQYRVGFNYPTPPDSDRGIDSSLLRVLADSFDLVRLCIEIRKHDISQLEWDIVPVEKNRSKRDQWLKDNGQEMIRIKQFFQWPEAYPAQDAASNWVRRGKVKWEDWIGALLEDYFVGDFLTVWPRILRNGELIAFDRVDGATIKPLLDLDGRLPEPPTPAYQQYLYGVPRASFTLETLLYRPRLVRNHSVFGFSHIEQMLVLINMALRFQMWNTQGYTDSSLPLGLLEFPDNFSPDQIQAVVETLNAAMSGLASSRQQFHGVPSGTKWNPIKPFQFDETFAQYVVEYTAAMFGLNAQKLGFMPGRGGQGLGGKGFAEQQSADTEGKATMPDARWIEALMNELIERCFGRDDVHFVFTDLQDTDEKGQIEADQAAITAGLKSWDQALEERGEEPVGISEPFIVIGNTIWTVEDVKAAQEGEPRNPQLPALPEDEPLNPPPPPPAQLPPPTDGGNGDPSAPHGSGDGSGELRAPQPVAPGSPEPAATEKPKPGEQTAAKPGAKPRFVTVEQAREAGRAASKPAPKSAKHLDDEAEKFDTSSNMQPHGLVHPDVDELRRWKRMATKAARAGRRQRPFATTLIPDQVKTLIAGQVEHATSREEVRAIFDTVIGVVQKAAKPETATVAGLCVRAKDTGRILMLQRSIADEDDPARGTWEFPGGHLEDGEQPLDGAIREWQEETGVQLPGGEPVASFRNGIYECFIYVVPSEADVPLNVDADDRAVVNPDDPDGDDSETLAWWAPSDAKANPALRSEAKGSTDWGMIDRAVPDAQFKLAGILVELAKAAATTDDDSERERRIKEIAAAGAALLATHLAASYGTRVALERQTDDIVSRLANHYGQAVLAGTTDAADEHGIAQLTRDQVKQIAQQRAEAQRGKVRDLVEHAGGGEVAPQDIHFLARGAKPAYEQGYGQTVTAAAPESIAIWKTTGPDPCNPCGGRDGQVFTVDELPGWPGDGDFGGDLCEGGPNDRCELEWRIQPGAGADDEG